MNIIIPITLLASFVGGAVALFAPCCITFLLPSYLANIFKNKEKVVWMTLVFGLGIATILVPTALGIRAIGELFQSWHTQTYLIGGAFMIALGLMNLTGKKITLPMINWTIDLNSRHDPWSIYLMGIISGITSSCCTPVLAGILTLSFLSPDFLVAFLSGLLYVAGMVTPLVILALILDRIEFGKLPALRHKTVRIFGKEILLTDAVAGVIFLLIGVLFIYLAVTGKIVMESQEELGRSLRAQVMGWIASFAR